MTVTASAPGKLVLFGDHAAVYGEPCLVTAVDLRFAVTVTPLDQPIVEISTPDLRARSETSRINAADLSAHNRPETAFVEAALKQIYQHYPANKGFKIITDGPRISYGLGSSSAITAATLMAAAHSLGITLSLREIFDLAYAAVLDVQGTGSGVDLAAAVYGGTLYYVNKGEMIEPLPVNELPIVIGYSGEKVSTTNLIAHVAAQCSRYPNLIDPLLHMLGDISTQARAAILASDWSALGDLMNIHQGILDAFGVNTPQLAHLIFASREAGALGAKLSGAGGGDCMFALTSPEARQIVEFAITKAGGFVVTTPTGASGVRIETVSHNP
jgi:mevalonate kinase